jgi:hypothetical protein
MNWNLRRIKTIEGIANDVIRDNYPLEPEVQDKILYYARGLTSYLLVANKREYNRVKGDKDGKEE